MPAPLDITGQRFGMLVAVSPTDRPAGKNRGGRYWLCKCDCGNNAVVLLADLRIGDTKSCGCNNTRKPINEVGNRYGRLVVQSYHHTNIHGRQCFMCKCDCGNTVVVDASLLRTGKTHSCGCFRKETAAEMGRVRNRTHGKLKTRLYKIWSSMNTRCRNPKSDCYKHYGARGITVCEEWTGQDGFQNFWDWAYSNGYDETAPKGQCTIDRIDVNRGYCPENCRWVTMKKQANNKRVNTFYTIGEETHTVAEWSEISSVQAQNIRARLKRGWPLEKAIFYTKKRKVD